jgi:hypothetical protein
MRLLTGTALVLVASCSRPSPAPQADSLVHTLTIPADLSPDLPDALGRAELYTNCLTCHSSRYVATQPPFARKTWQAEVDKMRNVYGAPIAADDASKIVDYLVATHRSG